MVVQGLLQVVALLHVQHMDQAIPTGRGQQGQPCEWREWPWVPRRLLDALASWRAARPSFPSLEEGVFGSISFH